MSERKPTIIAFDAYGTLLSTSSIAKQLAEHFGDKADDIATEWRRLQLEYTWRANSMGFYEPFPNLTARALMHALSVFSLALSADSTTSLMKSYESLDFYPEVQSALSTLNAASSPTETYIFSNGTHATLLPTLSPLFPPDRIITVEAVQKFKPCPETYWHLLERVGVKREDAGRVWLVSSNPFDVLGARAVGMRTCWVDRVGGGWRDGLVEEGGPDVITGGVDGVVDAIGGFKG